MNIRFDRTLALVFGTVATVLVVNAGVSYQNTRQLDDDARWVAHTHEVLEATESLLGILVDAETNQRGFLLTGDPQFLDPYTLATGMFEDRLSRVKTLTADNPRQQERSGRLKGLIEARLAILARVLDVYRQAGPEAARRSVQSSGGKRAMDDCRAVVREMCEEERTLLQGRESARRRAYATAVISGGLALITGLAAVGAAAWFVGRSARDRGRADAARHQHALIQSIVAGMGDGVIVTDTAGRVTLLNRVAEQLTGWANADAAGRPIEDVFCVVNGATRLPVDNPARRAMAEGRVVLLAENSTLLSKAGAEWPVDDSAAPITNDGTPVGAVLVFREITARHKAEQALAEAGRRRDESLAAVRTSEAKFRSVLDELAEGVFVLDPDTLGVTEANGAFLRLAGRGGEDVSALTLHDFLAADRVLIDWEMNVLREQGHLKMGRRQLRSAGGATVDVDVSLSQVVVGGRRVVAGVVRDTTEQRAAEDRLFEYQSELEEANAKLKAMATTDGLTGVRNRAAFDDRLAEACDRAARHPQPLSVMLLDVDHFKRFNDTFGHPAGDEALRGVARALQNAARSSDFLARYGGEEFVAILPDTDFSGAMVVAERCRRAVAALPCEHQVITVSIGVSTWAPTTAGPAGLVEEADQALYHAKRAGRNRVLHAMKTQGLPSAANP